MKYLKMLSLAAVAAMALMAMASSASATTLEVGGTAKNASVSISATLTSGSSATLRTTGELFANTCTESAVAGATATPFTATKVTGALTTLSFKKCTEEEVVVDNKGQLYVEFKSGTNGTVFSENAEVTVPTPFGKVNCKTSTGTDVGTLTGVKTGKATMDINAVLNCGFLLPSAVWEGSYTVTSPEGLGVVS